MTKPVEKTIFMPKKAFNKWIKHLTDGKIKQGQNNLINEDGSMCCLGVLQYALDGTVEDDSYPSYEFLSRNNIKFLNRDSTEENEPFLTGGNASDLNDIHCLSFKKIAQRLKSRVQFVPDKK